MLRITTKQRSNDWIAFLTDWPATREVGRTEQEALGRLVITLALTWGMVELVREDVAAS